MDRKDGCNGRLEAAYIFDFLYLFGKGNFIFIREKSVKSQATMYYFIYRYESLVQKK